MVQTFFLEQIRPERPTGGEKDMSINVKGMLGGAARVAAGAALLVAAGSAIAPAHALKKVAIASTTGGTGPGPLMSTYFDLGYYGYGNDDVIRLTNVAGVNACAFIYVFDTNQELQEACAVGLTPNKELAFDVSANLTSNPAFGNFSYDDIAGIIEIISGTPNTGSGVFSSVTEGINCDPAATISPLTAVNAYLETSVVVESYGYWLPGATVLPFTDDGNPDATNLSVIQTDLGVLGSEIGSSGKGVCYTDPWLTPSTNTGAASQS
jgi:hypothetical protein